MISRRFLGGLAAGALLFGTATTRITLGQAPSQASSVEFEKTVAPVLSKSCIACHNDRARMGNLSLEVYTDAATALAHPEVWQKVLNKLAAGEMPPRNAAPLTAAELAAVIAWVKTVPGVSEMSAAPSAGSAGRVTARRLNRVEYNNTIRDRRCLRSERHSSPTRRARSSPTR
jgi:mono/diheme cytochrome c family protein